MQPSTNFVERLFEPLRFGILLALLIFAAFPQVILGLESFIARDFGFFAYPLAHFQRDCFWRGELPFWNPYNDCGVPFLAQWNTMPLYPPSLVYLTLPLHWSLSFFCLLHLWFAGLGMYFLARRWTASNFAAAFAGTVFAFNGFTLNLLMWPSHIATFSWVPWVIFLTEAAWREGGKKIPLAAFVGALQMLAGGPETIFLTWLITAALWLQQVVVSGTPRLTILWRFPLVVALVVSLTLAQLLPFLDLVAHAQRSTGYTDLRWSMPGSGLANFLVPMAFGSSATEGIFFQHGQAWTSSYYLGLGTLWLAVLAIFSLRDRRIWLIAALAAVALLCALGENTPFYPLLRKLIPQLSFITYPVKFVMVPVFVAPLLAGLALANLGKIRGKLLPLGFILLALIGGVIVWTQLAAKPGQDARVALVNGFSRAGFLILAGATMFALSRETKNALLRFAPLGLILVAWLDVLTHEPKQNPTAPPSVYELNLARTKLAMKPQPELGGPRAMLSPTAALELTRFAASDAKNNFLAKRAGYCANANLLDAVPKVDGFFSLTPNDFDYLLSWIYSETNADWSWLEDFMGVAQITAPGKLLEWQVRTNFLPLVTAGQRPLIYDYAGPFYDFKKMNLTLGQVVFIHSMDSDALTVSNGTSAKVLSHQFGFQTVDAEVNAAEPALVVVAQTYYHNWRAEIDGRPTALLRANVAFQAVQIPAGTHKLHLFYRDRAFEVGAAISLCMWVNCFVAWLALRRRELPPSPATEKGDQYF